MTGYEPGEAALPDRLAPAALAAAIAGVGNLDRLPTIGGGVQTEINPGRVPPKGNGYWDLQWSTNGKFAIHMALDENLGLGASGPYGIGIRGGIGMVMDNKGYGGIALRISMQGEYDTGPSPITGNTALDASQSIGLDLRMGSVFGVALSLVHTVAGGRLANFQGHAAAADTDTHMLWQTQGATVGEWKGDGTLRWRRDINAWSSTGTAPRFVAASVSAALGTAHQAVLDGSVQGMNLYRYSGASGLWYASRVTANATRTLSLQTAYTAAAQGAESLLTGLSIKAASATVVQVALYGGTPVTQPARKGQLTDSSGGTSGGATVAAVTDLPSAANAIATLVAKINALETALSAAGGGIGVTA